MTRPDDHPTDDPPYGSDREKPRVTPRVTPEATPDVTPEGTTVSSEVTPEASEVTPGASGRRDPARPCELVPAGRLSPADPTPGMSREVALSTGGMWSGTVDTQAGAVTGWHHHGEHETTLYIVSGTFRLESGPAGEHVVEAHEGDFLHVPAGAVHRESNPGDRTSRAVVVRCGSGVPTVNVEAPAAAG